MTSIIGIVGFKGSGKDTLGNFLIEDYGYRKDSFASPLKDAAAAVFGWQRSLLEGDTRESREWRETPDEWWERELDWSNHAGRAIGERFTPRVALQLIGTDVLRKNFHNDIWILSLKHRLREANQVVITDCRFPNEIRAIRSLGGRVVRVKRGPEPEWYGLAHAANNDTFLHSPECFDEMVKLGIHISEWAWIGTNFDSEISNDSTLEDLRTHASWLVKPR